MLKTVLLSQPEGGEMIMISLLNTHPLFIDQVDRLLERLEGGETIQEIVKEEKRRAKKKLKKKQQQSTLKLLEKERKVCCCYI